MGNFYFIIKEVNTTARFPPADSPVIIIFVGLTLKYLCMFFTINL